MRLCGNTALTALIKGDAMKQNYDFSNGERGKFFRPDAVFKEPVYLDDEIQAWLSTRADSEGVDLSALDNDLFHKNPI